MLPDIKQFPLIKAIVKTSKGLKDSGAGEDGNLSGGIAELQKSIFSATKLSKSLEFVKTGAEIKAGIMIKIAKLEGEIKALQTTGAPKPENADVEVAVAENESTGEPWEIKSRRRQIERLYRIIRNLDDKKRFKLSEYDLDAYGL